MTDHRNIAPIVVGVDGSSAALRAVRWATAEAVRREAPLRLVHGYVVPTRGYPTAVVSARQVREGIERQGREWLTEAGEVATAEDGRVHVETALVAADPIPALLRESDHAALIVVGSRGLGGFAGMLLGSNSAALAAHGRCPVVVVRASTPLDDPPHTGPVIVGVDGSPASDAALGLAFQEAALRGTSLRAVHAWRGFSTDVTVRKPGESLPCDELDPELGRDLSEQFTGWQRKFPEVPAELSLIRGRPAATLLDLGRHAQLLVVGSRGRGGFAGLLLGSTGQALIHHAPCPVSVVRPTAAVAGG